MTSAELAAQLIVQTWDNTMADNIANSVRFDAVDVLAYRMRFLHQLEARLGDDHRQWFERVLAELDERMEGDE